MMVKLQCPESLDIRPNGLESNISLDLLSLLLRMGRENWGSGEMDTAGERPGMGEERETRLKRAAAQGAQKMWAFPGLRPEGVLTYQDLIHEGCQSKQQPQLRSPD